MPNYNFATLGAGIFALAARLYDPDLYFWTQAELQAYIIESLRTFNALTSFWRSDFTFSLQSSVGFYDLSTVSGTNRPYTVTDTSLVNQIEYHLLEPLTTTYPLAWTGTLQYVITDILGALERRQNETLGETGCTVVRSLVTAPASNAQILLDDATIAIRRIAWFPGSGSYSKTVLRQTDPLSKRAFDYGWITAAAAAPSSWIQVAEPPPAFDVDRTPPVAGQYEVLSVRAASTPNILAASLTNIPDDWTWVAKWGALADLFNKESNAKDSLRAQYCEKRYKDGLALMAKMPVVLAVKINSIPYSVDAIKNGDDFNPSWQAATAGAPVSVYAAANLLAVAPTPDGGTYTVTVTTVENAPVPSALSDKLQVSREIFDSIIDYAQHLAMAKVGGAEFGNSFSLYQSFMQCCGRYNSALKEMGFFDLPMEELSQNEAVVRPRYGIPEKSGLSL